MLMEWQKQNTSVCLPSPGIRLTSCAPVVSPCLLKMRRFAPANIILVYQETRIDRNDLNDIARRIVANYSSSLAAEERAKHPENFPSAEQKHRSFDKAAEILIDQAFLRAI
jgi:hypothetical protein